MASIWFLCKKVFPGRAGIVALLNLIAFAPFSGFSQTLSAAISPASFTTNHPFAVTITTWPTTATTYYQLNGGAWLVYTNPFTIGDGKNAATVQVDSYATDGVSFSPTNSATYVYQPPAVVNDFFVDRIALAPPPVVYADTVNGTTFQHPGFWTNLNVTLTGATM